MKCLNFKDWRIFIGLKQEIALVILPASAYLLQIWAIQSKYFVTWSCVPLPSIHNFKCLKIYVNVICEI